MKKLICTRGISASGKSTWAKNEVLQSNAMRFNKDDIRKDGRLFPDGYVYSKENEEIVVKEERDGVLAAMVEGREYIIVDNTHLGQWSKHIKLYSELAEKHGYEFEIKDFGCSREEAIKRDSARDEGDRVGESVINKQIKIQGNGGYPLNPTFKQPVDGLPHCVIVDIDGTLAFMDGKRSPYEFDKVEGDRCNEHLKALLRLINVDKIFIVSGRGEECKEETEAWLMENDIHYNSIFMRKEGDNRDDAIVKSEIYEKHIKDKYNVFAVFDDRQKVVDMWRLKHSLPVYQVWYGNF